MLLLQCFHEVWTMDTSPQSDFEDYPGWPLPQLDAPSFKPYWKYPSWRQWTKHARKGFDLTFSFSSTGNVSHCFVGYQAIFHCFTWEHKAAEEMHNKRPQEHDAWRFYLVCGISRFRTVRDYFCWLVFSLLFFLFVLSFFLLFFSFFVLFEFRRYHKTSVINNLSQFGIYDKQYGTNETRWHSTYNQRHS